MNIKRQIILPLDLDYEEIEYKEAKTRYALVKPDRTFFLLIEKLDYLDRETKFIFVYNNIQDLKLLETYVFPENYDLENYEGLSYYEDDLYLDGDKLVFN